ncbi:MAG: M20 family metallopeptidase [Brotaphodocola sp.]
MNKEKLLSRAKELQPELQEIRSALHRHPETGFDLTETLKKVRQELEQMGYEPKSCGKAGLIALAGGKHPGKTIMLRADMDALPLAEEANVNCKSEIPGKMHGCGHDMHTTMLLGAAKLLKEHEEEIQGTVKLVFQPAEEIFQGAQDMIDHGVLENPHVDAAVMFHVVAGTPMPSGMITIPAGGISMSSCEQYHITIKGKGGHGSTPHLSIDPVTAAAHIHLALQEINSRELDPNAFGVFTTCKVRAGETSNVIPDSAEMWGTIRTADPEEKINQQIRTRMTEIAQGVGAAMRCLVDVEFYDYCPCMVVDESLANDALQYMQELIGPKAMQNTSRGGGSEDFAFVSHLVPTVGMFLSVGCPKEGYEYSVHNPKVTFNDSVLFQGSAAYAYMALRWLEK